jgi:hypothetical protein
MVEVTRREPIIVVRVLDQDGRPIGQVLQPRSAPVVGLGARTVLLVRTGDETNYFPPRTFC